MEVHPLTTYRDANSITRKQLAGQFGVSPATITRWENGSRIPHKKFLPTIAKLTGTPIAELIGVEDGADD